MTDTYIQLAEEVVNHISVSTGGNLFELENTLISVNTVTFYGDPFTEASEIVELSAQITLFIRAYVSIAQLQSFVHFLNDKFKVNIDEVKMSFEPLTISFEVSE